MEPDNFTPLNTQNFSFINNITQTDNNNAPKKSKLITIISILIFIRAILYSYNFLVYTFIFGALIWGYNKAGLIEFAFLKYYPLIGIIPIAFPLMTFFLYFVSLKINNGSKLSYLMGILLMIIVPVTQVFLANSILVPFFRALTVSLGTASSQINKNFNAGDPLLPLTIIILVLLIISYKKFNFSNKGLSLKSKIFLIIIFLLLVMPSVSYFSYGYFKAYGTDYNYTKIKSMVNYHIYKPTFIPGGREIATNFEFKEILDIGNGVKVIYDSPLNEIIEKGKGKGIIALSQIGVDNQFNLESYIKKETSKSKVDVNKKVQIIPAKDNVGYYFEFSKWLRVIYFVTPDNTLIIIATTLSTSEAEIIQFAQALK